MPASNVDLDNLDPDKLSDMLGNTPTNMAPPNANMDELMKGINDSPVAQHAAASQELIGKIGSRPELALPQSPLSIAERAAFGWMKFPDKQQKYLEDNYGKGNVSFEKMDKDGNSNFVVKDKGVWKQVDPAGLSDISTDILSGLGNAAISLSPLAAITGQGKKSFQSAEGDFADAKKVWKNVTIGNTLGGAAQFMAQRGAAVAGAAEGGAQGALAGAALGPWGSAAGGILGGVAGGGLGEAAEAGVRDTLKAISDATGFDIPGAKYVDSKELQQQTMASMILGGAQEAGGMVLKGGANAFAGMLKSIGDAPTSKYALSKLLKVGTDITDSMSRIWADDPEGVAAKNPVVQQDLINNTHNATKAQNGLLENWLTEADEGRKSLGNDFRLLENDAKKASFNPMSTDDPAKSIPHAMADLYQNRFLSATPEGGIPEAAIGELERNLSDTDKKYLRLVEQNFHALDAKGTDATYGDMLAFKQNLGDALYSKEGVNNGKLTGILTNMYNAVNQQMSDGLHKADPALADRFMNLNRTYSIVGETLGDINKKTDGSKLDTFLKRMTKDDGTGYQHELVDTINNALGLENPTNNIIQWEIAKKTAPMFIRGRIGEMANIAGIPIPTPTGGQAMRLGQAGASVADQLLQGLPQVTQGAPAEAAAQSLSDKYLKQMHTQVKAMPDDTRAALIRNPQAIDQMEASINQSAQAEQQQTQAIAQQMLNMKNAILSQPLGVSEQPGQLQRK
jgi:hypothetical protein